MPSLSRYEGLWSVSPFIRSLVLGHNASDQAFTQLGDGACRGAGDHPIWPGGSYRISYQVPISIPRRACDCLANRRLTRGSAADIVNLVVMRQSELNLVFGALADPIRRGILEQLARGETNVGTLALMAEKGI